MIGRVNTGGGGKGAALTVTAPGGSTVTVSKDSKMLTRVAGADGVVVFRGLETGTWMLSITDGTQTASKTVDIVADYATTITFFAATIHITYPAGSVCTATDGTTTLMAPDTSGTWNCTVPNAGTWTVSLNTGLYETIDIAENGSTQTLDGWHLYNAGYEYDSVTGGWISDDRAYGGAGTTKAYPVVTKNDTSIYAVPAGAGKAGTVRTANAIDITGFAKLEFDGILTKGGVGAWASLCLWSVVNGYWYDTAVAMLSSPVNGVGYIDLSGVPSGKYYIGLGVYHNDGASATMRSLKLI